MYDNNYLKDLAIKILTHIEKTYSIESGEVFIQNIAHIEGGTEFRTPKNIQIVQKLGCALRFFKDKGLYFTSFSLPRSFNDIDSIIKMKRFAIKKRFFDFPEISPPKKEVANLYDKNIASMDLSNIMKLFNEVKKSEDLMKKDIILDPIIHFFTEKRIIANTSHSMAFERGTWVNLTLRALYKGANMISSGETYYTSRLMPRSLADVVNNLIIQTIQRSTERVKISNLLLPVIFSPDSFAELLSYILVPNVISSNGTDLIAEQSFSEDFTLVDDGTVPGLPNSTAFDDEGTAQSQTIIVEKGKLKNKLNDLQSVKDEKERTGNSFRFKMYELFPRQYNEYPRVSPSNLIVEGGNKSFGDIVSQFSEAILVNSLRGAISSNYYNGDFSVIATDSYLIENGAIAGSIPNLNLNGNLYELLSNQPRFTSERKVVRPYNTPYSFLLPYIVSKNVNLLC